MRELLKSYYQPVASGYHYLHMAQGNYRQYLKGEEVWRKPIGPFRNGHGAGASAVVVEGLVIVPNESELEGSCITALDPATGTWELEVLAFEDAGARWILELERVDHFQFELDGPRATDAEVATAAANGVS